MTEKLTLYPRQKAALSLAKNSILEEFWDLNANQKLKDLIAQIQTWKYPELNEIKACFVTLKIGWKHLRGCIGSILATRPLYEDIIINAKNAAFRDPRFNPLSLDEVGDLLVEITVLSPLKQMKFENIEKLLEYLQNNHPWLVIKLENHSATFLPSVWKELPDAQQFLTHLIYKAWLTPQVFIENFDKVEIFIYSGEEFAQWWNQIWSDLIY